MKKTLLLLLTLMCSVGMWAEEVEIASFSNSSNDGWTIAGSPSYSNSGGYQLVASTMTITSPSINFSAYTNINITITCRKYGGPNATQGKISVKLGSTSGTELTTYSPGGTSLVSSGALKITPSSDGSLVIYCPGASSSKGCGVSQISIKGTQKATEAYTVTFNAGTNGNCSTTSIKEATAGAGITLPGCTPNSGFKFLGWTATEGNTTIDNGLTAGATYKPSANTTLYAVYAALYQVTIEDPENGTLSVTCDGTDVTSGEYYAVGQNINIVATPSTGYKFRNIQVFDGSTHTFTASNERVWNMGAHEITIKANFDEIVYRTITWSVNGNITLIAPSQVENGTNITFPTGLADINGKKFVGWSANENASSAGDLVSGEVSASDNAIYYAVFAAVTPGNQKTANLTITDTENVAYTNGLTRTDDKGNNWVSYACITTQSINKVNHFYIQINKNSNGYYIGSPDFGSSIKAISAKVWNTSSDKRYAYLKANTSTKQPSTSDYGTTEIAANSKNADINFTINNDAEFSQFYIYSSGAIGFESISVTYGEPDTYSDYTTTVATSTNITISSAGWATYYTDKEFTMPEGLEGYYVTYNTDETAIEIVKMYGEGEATTVPANEALLLRGAAKTYTLEYSNTAATAGLADANLLHGNLTAGTIPAIDGMGKYYKLFNGTNGIGWYWGEENGGLFTMGANKAYLALPADPQAKSSFAIDFSDVATGINAIKNVNENDNVIYNLNGMRVNNAMKGVYIKNGKKFINK